MDELKPEDGLKPDSSDRRSGRSRNADAYDNEPQLNVDDIEIDMDDSRSVKQHREREDEDDYVIEENMAAEPRSARGRKKAARQKAPLSRQYLMMGTGIIVLLLLIFGIGSALKSPSSSDSAGQSSGAEKSIDLSGAGAGSEATAEQHNASSSSSDMSIPPISSTPTQAQNLTAPQGQQRVEVAGDLSNSLIPQQGQAEPAVSQSTLPTEPATVAALAGGKNGDARPERKRAVIEPAQKAPAKSQATASNEKPSSSVRRHEPTRTAPAPVKAPTAVAQTQPKATAPAAAAPAQPKAAAPAQPKAAAPAQAKTTAPAAAPKGNAGALQSAPGGSYTLQLSSSSNEANLNAWAKKENLKNYIVYQTERNGKPWYVMVSGIYASKEEAERAVSTLPAGVQSNKPWTKPIHQVKSEIK